MNEDPKNTNPWYLKLAMFIILGAIIGTGAVINLVLVPGQERWLMHGASVRVTFWGLDAQAWGRIQLILAAIFLVIFVVHWMFVKPIPPRSQTSSLRKTVFVFAVIAFIGFAGIPFLGSPGNEPVEEDLKALPLENMSLQLNDSIRVRMKKPKPLDTPSLNVVIEHPEESEKNDAPRQ
jgi:hypothetical protein